MTHVKRRATALATAPLALLLLAGCSNPVPPQTSRATAQESAPSALTETPTPTPSPTAPTIDSAAQLLTAWKGAGLPCKKQKDSESLYASEVVRCGTTTILSYFASSSNLRKQDEALRSFGKQGLAKQKVLQGETWTIQSTTPNLRKAEAAFGGVLSDAEDAGKKSG